jgi:hypothetical protein
LRLSAIARADLLFQKPRQSLQSPILWREKQKIRRCISGKHGTIKISCQIVPPKAGENPRQFITEVTGTA